MANLLRGPSGPVVRHTIVVTQKVQDNARPRIGVSEGPGPHLRDTLVKRLEPPNVRLVAQHPRAAIHHDGTRPHEIRPKKAKVLVFNVGGRTVFTQKVRHPGTKPNRFLLDAARALGLRVRER